MSTLLKVIALLKSKVTENTYSGEIPESQSEPSIAVANIANPFSRDVEGGKVKKSSTWRITIVAVRQSDVESLMEKLEDIDNSRNADFQKIFTSFVMTEFGLNEQPFRRAFYDLTVY